jgi:hypothetical protein
MMTLYLELNYKNTSVQIKHFCNGTWLLQDLVNRFSWQLKGFEWNLVHTSNICSRHCLNMFWGVSAHRNFKWLPRLKLIENLLRNAFTTSEVSIKKINQTWHMMLPLSPAQILQLWVGITWHLPPFGRSRILSLPYETYMRNSYFGAL